MAYPTKEQLSKAQTDARAFGDGTPYALDFTVNGESYTFVPENVAKNGGVTSGANTYLFPYFTNRDNIQSFSKTATFLDLSDAGVAKYLKSNGQDTKGFLIPSGDIAFDGAVNTQPTSTLNGSLNGLKIDQSGQVVVGLTGGAGSRYMEPNGTVHDPRTVYESSILGKVFGSAGNTLSNAFNETLSAINDLGPVANLAIAVASPPAAAVIAGANAGQAAAQGDWERAALNAGKAAIFSNAGDGIFASNPSGADAMAADNIDVGGGWNPATGTGDAATAAAAADTGVTSSASTPHYGSPSTTPEFSDFAKGAAIGAGSAAALGSLLIPEVPGAGPTYEAKKTEPDWSIKFDDPVQQMQVPESFDFQLDSTPSPYLNMSQTGPIMGDMLFDPTQAYNSNLVKGLRANSNAPSSVNPGFTLYQSAKP